MPSLPRRALDDAERLDWVRLIRSENVGPITFFNLLDRFGSASAALKALPDLARRGGRAKPLRIAPRAEAERELAANRSLGARVVCACEPDYPPRLTTVDDRPPVLSIRGHPHLLTMPTVAIVGARNASLNGRRLAGTLAQDLGRAGCVVVSGLARGIDTAAHEGSLATGTVAVMAGGIDVVYPEENRDLYARIAEAGVILAETAIGSQPQARHFPRRNRIISGVALGVVVVEAAAGSGSLITAQFAADQGREVFAVPGSPLDPRCRGVNGLIKHGATLVESAEDILSVLTTAAAALGESQPRGFATGPAPTLDDQTLTEARPRVLEALGPAPVSIDELLRDCQLSPPVVLTVLLELELAGRIEHQPGNRVNLI